MKKYLLEKYLKAYKNKCEEKPKEEDSDFNEPAAVYEKIHEDQKL